MVKIFCFNIRENITKEKYYTSNIFKDITSVIFESNSSQFIIVKSGNHSGHFVGARQLIQPVYNIKFM